MINVIEINKKTVIAINALTSRGNAGVRSYVRQLTTQMPREFPNDEYVIFINEELLSEFVNVPSNVKLICIDTSIARSIKRLLYEQIYMPIVLYRLQVDVLYILAVTDIFLAPCPTIIRVGNMLPYTKEAMATQSTIRNIIRLNILRFVSAISRRTSDRTLVMSNAAAKILVSKNGFDENKTLGINRGVSLSSIYKGTFKGGEIPDRYILIVSHLSEYKCLNEVVDACNILGAERKNYKIVIAGEIKDKKFGDILKKKILDSGLIDSLILIGFVPREELGELIDRSYFCIFPSMVETCPVTLLEMMGGSKAIICSNQSVMPEICQDSVLYYDPRDSHLLAKRMMQLINDENLVVQYGLLAKARVIEFDVTWNTAIARRYELFKTLSKVRPGAK